MTLDRGLDGVVAPKVRLGSCPDSWGVWFAEDPAQTPWPRFLDELAASGYEWLELGPYGYLPTDPVQLSEELERRSLRLSAGDVAEALHRDGRFEADLAAARNVARLVQALGAHHLVVLPEQYRDLAGRETEPRSLDDDAWKRLASGLSEIGRVVAGEHGVSVVFHPHADSHVGSEQEIERLLESTDPDAVSLCLDTGHVAYCGGDSVSLVERFAERIGYVHLKQVDPAVLEQVRAADACFAEAVRRGVMCEPPRGIPAMEPVLAALAGLDRELFAMVEQDLYPCDDDVPLPIAQRTRRHLLSCGIPGRR